MPERIWYRQERMVPMTKSLAPSKTVKVTDRDSKGLKFMSIVGTAYTKAGLTEEEAQRVNDAPGLPDLIAGFIAEHRYTDKFKTEEVKSDYRYLSGYAKPRDLMMQIDLLQHFFPDLRGTKLGLITQIVDGRLQFPEHAEGWFTIPNWIKNPKLFGTSYARAVQAILKKIQETHGRFQNYRESQITDRNLRQSARSVESWKQISEAQSNPDILIVPAQFGLRHRGRSGRRALEVMTGTAGEFGLGAFALGIMLLTHPERLKDVNDLWIDCTGDEFDDLGSDVHFDSAPFFVFYDNRVKFDARWLSNAGDHFGSGSGFVPQ